MNAEAQKRAAAARAVEFVTNGMRLGLGTGSTAKHFVELVGERGVLFEEQFVELLERCVHNGVASRLVEFGFEIGV